jgi:DNA-binding GntR family transcriptional regulator
MGFKTARNGVTTVPDDASSNGAKMSQVSRALETVRDWILTGEVIPNDRLIEVELAKSLEVSRTTIRAVLLDLNKEGFVMLEQNRGARVRSFSPEEARDILILRERLEGIAASLAAENMSLDSVEELEGILDHMTVAKALPDPEAHAKLRQEFHAHISAGAQNPTLAKFIEQTRYQLVVRQFWDEEIPHPRPDSLNEHIAIAVAIRGRDPVAAERLMRLHLSNARNALRLNVAGAGAGL